MAKMGRPRKELDWIEFDKLCFMQCLQTEIAAWFDMSIKTLSRRVEEAHGVTFDEYYNQKKEGGKIALRRAMWQKAIHKEDRVMMIWISKQYLGFKEPHQHTIQGTGKREDRLIIDFGTEKKEEKPKEE